MGIYSYKKKGVNKMTTKGYGTYFIHSNGDRPFKVNLSKDGVRIYKAVYDEDYDPKDYKLIKTFKSYKGVWIPMKGSKFGKGNSILVKIKEKEYLYIGSTIYKFKTNDEITGYNSPIGNNDVPYPYALGKKYIYLMLETVKIPIDKMNDEKPVYLEGVEKHVKDPYTIYYNEKMGTKFRKTIVKK